MNDEQIKLKNKLIIHKLRRVGSRWLFRRENLILVLLPANLMNRRDRIEVLRNNWF